MSAPAFPASVAGLTLDDVNYRLRVGMASKEDAEAYVRWWNTSGKRLTTATLEVRAVSLNGVSLMAPYISIR